MRMLKPEGLPVNFDGIDRKFLFNLNVIDDVQEHFDMPIGEILDIVCSDESKNKRKALKYIPYIVAALCNEDARIYNKTAAQKRENITEEELKENITQAIFNYLATSVVASFISSMPKRSEEEEQPDPNAVSE